MCACVIKPDCDFTSTPEDGPDRLSRNVGKQLQPTLHNIPRQRKPEGKTHVWHWSQFVYKTRDVRTLFSLCRTPQVQHGHVSINILQHSL